jgi:hypothetical protein
MFQAFVRGCTVLVCNLHPIDQDIETIIIQKLCQGIKNVPILFHLHALCNKTCLTCVLILV